VLHTSAFDSWIVEPEEEEDEEEEVSEVSEGWRSRISSWGG